MMSNEQTSVCTFTPCQQRTHTGGALTGDPLPPRPLPYAYGGITQNFWSF